MLTYRNNASNNNSKNSNNDIIYEKEQASYDNRTSIEQEKYIVFSDVYEYKKYDYDNEQGNDVEITFHENKKQTLIEYIYNYLYSYIR
jgi:hypothetical protein